MRRIFHGGQASTSRRRAATRVSLILLLVVPWLLASGAGAASHEASEVGLKSAFLFKFTHYTQWPLQAMGAAGSPIAMCVAGRDALADGLERAVKGRNSQKRPLAVKRIEHAVEATGCHVLFIGWSEPGRIDRVLGMLARQPTLIVGDVAGFARRGGMINLTKKGNRLRFEINRRAVEGAGLRLSSQLLKLANLIEDESGGED